MKEWIGDKVVYTAVKSTGELFDLFGTKVAFYRKVFCGKWVKNI